VENDLTVSNSEHSQPRNILVAHNTLVNNYGGIVIGRGDNPAANYLPQNITVANNIITARAGSLVTVLGGDVEFTNNVLLPLGAAAAGDISQGDFVNVDPQLRAGSDGLLRPSTGSPVIDSLLPSEAFGITTDMDGQARTGRIDIGADEVR
jgi:hypothetical protein